MSTIEFSSFTQSHGFSLGVLFIRLFLGSSLKALDRWILFHSCSFKRVLSERRARSWFCFRAALDSSDGSGARGARTRGCSPLDRPTATDSKSGEKRETEFSDYPRKGGGKRGGRSKNANSAHGRMATRRTGRRAAGGGREGDARVVGAHVAAGPDRHFARPLSTERAAASSFHRRTRSFMQTFR